MEVHASSRAGERFIPSLSISFAEELNPTQMLYILKKAEFENKWLVC